jgi:PIN domain nuclease of toxin-antitoxin system
VSADSSRYGGFHFRGRSAHRDAFDRQIIAQALSEDMPVLTPETRFGLYKGLKVLW